MLLYRFNKFLLANSAARSKMVVFDMMESTPLFRFTVMNIFTATETVVNLDSVTLAGLDEAAQVAMCEQVSFITLSVMVHPDKVFSGCRSPMKTLASTMYELPMDPGVDAFAIDLMSLLAPNALMSECNPAPSEIK
jgi:hypothetical protein